MGFLWTLKQQQMLNLLVYFLLSLPTRGLPSDPQEKITSWLHQTLWAKLCCSPQDKALDVWYPCELVPTWAPCM